MRISDWSSDVCSSDLLYQGGFFALFKPFPVLCGLISVCMLAMHGSVLLGWKTVDPVSARARTAARVFGVVTAILFVAAGFWVRSEGRSVGTEWVSTCRSRWWPDH